MHGSSGWSFRELFDVHGETIELEAELINRTTRGIPGPMDDSRAFIWAKLGAMLLQCYPENLHKITFDICDAHRYLPLADRLEKLGTVFLHYFRGLTNGHAQDTISFLSRDRIAYPRKKPVQIEFGVEWEASWNQKHASERQRQQSWIKLIKSVGHPVQIDARRCPEFYEDILEGIELDALETFVDTDRYHRCVALKYLQLNLIGSNVLLCSKDDSTAPSIAPPTETQPAALNARLQTESKLKSIVLKGCWRIPLDVLTSLFTDYAPDVTALRVERIEDDLDLVGPGGTQ
ncbi:hypothetical protein BG006_010565 [Podila minutissima]|uniref:Uncharacterized protein n=1 Tax=Podila minutissima TaxID=64525 RepID=A0A9P5SCY3_9FUNG|nr:hypothetical protein BG006_010565 [Podila minutissima]